MNGDKSCKHYEPDFNRVSYSFSLLENVFMLPQSCINAKYNLKLNLT